MTALEAPLARAEEAYAAAQLLLEGGFYRDAISRSYVEAGETVLLTRQGQTVAMLTGSPSLDSLEAAHPVKGNILNMVGAFGDDAEDFFEALERERTPPRPLPEGW